MVDRDLIAATEAQWYAARTRMRRLGFQVAAVAIVLITGCAVPASAIASHFATGSRSHLLTAALMLAAALPLTGLVWWRMDSQQRLSNGLMKNLRRQLNAAIEMVELESGQRQLQVRRQDFERRLSSALEMAEGEPEVIEVIERALGNILPNSPAELLLADNSHAHLSRAASVAPQGTSPHCTVDSPDHCPAARRSQVQRFTDSDALDACPKLRGRPEGRSSALCVPVSIMGRTVGVLHAAAEPDQLPDATQTADLATLTDLVGARVGLLRVIAESQLQAATDSLTGLLNRRSMENKVRQVRRDVPRIAVVVADLDHFKQLNDTFGHDTGDRALRLFASTLAGALRREDLVSRHGGEEFVAVLPGCTANRAADALESVRTTLAAAVAEHGLPPFTCSFGVAEADGLEDFADVIARADVALFEAKKAGRDRAMVYGEALAPAQLVVAPEDFAASSRGVRHHATREVG